jgi:hypothetical protein
MLFNVIQNTMASLFVIILWFFVTAGTYFISIKINFTSNGIIVRSKN